jgi:SagB-type dehydrogenase family enzyme
MTPHFIVAYDEGAASPMEIGRALGELGTVEFAVVDTPHVHRAMPLLRHYGDVTSLDDLLHDPPARPRAVVLTFSERLLIQTARLAEVVGGYGHSPQTAVALADKVAQRALVARAGVDLIRHRAVGDLSELDEAIRHVGFPAVVKPARGGASQHTFLVAEPWQAGEVAAALARHDGVPDGFIVEEYLAGRTEPGFGDFVSVESVVVDGRITHLAVTGKLPLARPFRETGNFWPSHIGASDIRQAEGITSAVLEALDVRFGICHTELKLTPAGPRLIEVNGRLGGFIAELAHRAVGLDLVRVAGLVASGEEPELPKLDLDGVFFQYHNPGPLFACRLAGIAGASDVERLPGVDSYRLFIRPGTVFDAEVRTVRLDAVYGRAADHAGMVQLAEACAQRLRFSFSDLRDGGGPVEFTGRELTRATPPTDGLRVATPPQRETVPIAELYHRLSSYHPGRHWTEPLDNPWIRTDFRPMRPDAEPSPFKSYPPQCQVQALPAYYPEAPTSAAAVLGGELPQRFPGGLTLDDVTAVLFQTAGVVRVRTDRTGATAYFRAASSAGNRHPVETYLCSRDVSGLPDGVWHYDPRRHALTQVGPAPHGAGSAVVLCGVPWRTAWKYAERGYRHVFWDCGTMLSQGLLAARSRGIAAEIRTGFIDATVSQLVGAHRQEVPLAVLTLGPGEPALSPSAAGTAGDLGPGCEDFPLVDAVHMSGRLSDRAAVARWLAHHTTSRPGTVVSPPSDAAADPAATLVRNRGSARRFDPSRAISGDHLRWLLDLLRLPPLWDGGVIPEIRLLVHAVSGLRTGSYRVDPDGPHRTGPANRDRSREFCVDQELGRDAALLVCFVADGGYAADARSYRTALLAAGLGLGRLYLAAGALGIGCTGLTMVDAMVPEVLGEPVDCLAIAGLGIRPYAVRPGGQPGSPTALDTP